MKSIFIEPKKHLDIINITSMINSCLEEGAKLAVIFVKHTTAALFINEDEPNLLNDVRRFLESFIKESNFDHNRIDDRGNAKSHLLSILFQHSLVLPVINGKLDLGTWQSIFFVDFDGENRRREISVLSL